MIRVKHLSAVLGTGRFESTCCGYRDLYCLWGRRHRQKFGKRLLPGGETLGASFLS